MDLDVPILNGNVTDNSRLKKSLLTIKLLLEKGCKIVVIGHRGRPKGREEELSLRPIYAELMSLLEQNGYDVITSMFVNEVENREKISDAIETNRIVFMENLRFYEGEKSNDDNFLGAVKEICQCFVNDAFGVAHRKEASVMLWQKMPTYYGLNFVDEAEKLERLRQGAQRPLMVILGGAKEDKLNYLQALATWADKVLVAGKLVTMVKEEDMYNEKVKVGMLTESGLDINETSVRDFKDILQEAKTVVWVGSLGKFETEEGARSTAEMARFLAEKEVFWVMAGGDSVASVSNLGVENAIDLVISGGGVALEFLTKGTLCAWGD
jgi:phosphoglycerate kinase